MTAHAINLRALGLVKLTALMEKTQGKPDVVIGLIDGPVMKGHSDFGVANIREKLGREPAACAQPNSFACTHGTFVAGILCARRGSTAPAICPNCTLLIRRIFPETTQANDQMPSATPEELGAAILDCIEGGARVLNLSAALAHPSTNGERQLEESLDYAARRGVIVVAAAGNQGAIGSSAITRHPWVIPVVACELGGRPLNQSNIGNSLGRQGLRAPGENITSLGTDGKPVTSGGTSVAAPFVTGAIALLWSEFPDAVPAKIKLSITPKAAPGRAAIVPPLLDASKGYQALLEAYRRPVTV